jgi:hypothetical protein
MVKRTFLHILFWRCINVFKIMFYLFTPPGAEFTVKSIKKLAELQDEIARLKRRFLFSVK